MLKSRLVIFIILLSLITPANGFSQHNNKDRNILVLFAYTSDGPAYKRILNGIEEEIANQFGKNVTIHTEYLEIARYPQGNFPKEVFDKYNEKYSDIKLDLLICVGYGIIDPVKKNADEYLQSLHAVVLDLDFSSFGYQTEFKLNDKTAVIPLKFNFDKTLLTALSLFPKATSVSFLSGTSRLDTFLTLLTKAAAEKIISNNKITFDSNLSMNETIDLVENLPDNTIIFIPYYTTDSKLVPYHNTEAIRLIRSVAKSPIFHLSDLGLGEGAVGGYIINFAKAGSLAGKVATKILNGVDPNSIQITESDYYEYAFDYRELKRWNLINSNLIPAGSTIMYEDISFVDRYKWIGGLVLLFIVLQTLLIANLIRLNKNQKVMTKKIIDTENRYKDFLHQDRSLRLGQLTASLSHEINQPLTAILSNAQAGIRFIDSGEGDLKLLKQIFQKIVESDKRGASIVRSIRGMMKPDVSEKRKVELNNLINEVIAVYQNEISRNNIKMKTNLWMEPIFVLGDRIQIQQVLLNLISNASHSLKKVTHSNQIITISSSLLDDEAFVTVRDNGPGIDAEIKEKLFEPFVTSKNTGMGIGLTISQSIIEDHQGKIWAENLPESGAEFSFTLKLFANGK